MAEASALVLHLHEDSVRSLQRAAQERFSEAKQLCEGQQTLTAVYLYGYCAEMCLMAACFRRAGFTANGTIDRDARRRRMAFARGIDAGDGSKLMNSDPHPIVGWARLLKWMRTANATLPDAAVQCLGEAINKANVIYRHWRPELRYKTTQASPTQVSEVQLAAEWFLKNQNQL